MQHSFTHAISMLLKRSTDILLSVVVLTLLLPVFAIAVLAIWLESGSPILFQQERIGRGFRKFQILKFRTMQAHTCGPLLTVAGDRRVTNVGRFLRRTKIDELPQFWNVLRGDMSVVGPRPEVLAYVDLFRERYEKILTVRPGITDLASIYYRNEEQLLAHASDPIAEYSQRVLPAKLDLAELYLNERSALLDVAIVLRTAAVTLMPRLCKLNK